jgi:transcriptional regulator GlxA family with amidase domain
LKRDDRNDIYCTFSAMSYSVGIVVFPGFQLLDATGPIAAFEVANNFVPDAYRLSVLAPLAGNVVSSSGVAILADSLPKQKHFHTLCVVGGNGTYEACNNKPLVRYIRQSAARAARVVSICSGAFLLAAAGILDGRRAATHWSCASQLSASHPEIKVDTDAIWVRDGKIWTSAGIAAGIDLTLALVSADHGRELAAKVARQLVVTYRRPGGQSQHAELSEWDTPESRFAELHAWMRRNLQADLSVPRLARKAAMSERHFARVYTAETGITPGRAVCLLRLERARALLESGAQSVSDVAAQTGFENSLKLNRAFKTEFGVSPSRALRGRRPQTTSGV